MWVRSYWVEDHIQYGVAQPNSPSVIWRSFRSSRGCLVFEVQPWPALPGPRLATQLGWRYARSTPSLLQIFPRHERLLDFPGIQIASRQGMPPSLRLYRASVSYALVALPLLAIAVWRLFAIWIKRGSLIAHGNCVRCGYDLRASNDRCPECGTSIDMAARHRVAARRAALAGRLQRLQQRLPTSAAVLLTAAVLCFFAFCLTVSGVLWGFALRSTVIQFAWTGAPLLALLLGWGAVLESRRLARYRRAAGITLALGAAAAFSRLLFSLVEWN
jgi:hypothetical protein